MIFEVTPECGVIMRVISILLIKQFHPQIDRLTGTDPDIIYYLIFNLTGEMRILDSLLTYKLP